MVRQLIGEGDFFTLNSESDVPLKDIYQADFQYNTWAFITSLQLNPPATTSAARESRQPSRWKQTRICCQQSR
jgi:hypothetical protein